MVLLFKEIIRYEMPMDNNSAVHVSLRHKLTVIQPIVLFQSIFKRGKGDAGCAELVVP